MLSFFFFSSRRRHTRLQGDWSSDVCSSDLKAVDAKTGSALWKFKVGSGVVGNPITFTGPDGKQHLAVYAGIGGDWALLAGGGRSDAPADVRPPLSVMPGIAPHPSLGGIGWLFAFWPPG